MQKKILITGSNGLLGQKLIEALKNQHEVLATSIGDCIIGDTTGFLYQSLDITDRSSVIKTFENFNPDVVINTAAMTDVDGCEEKKELCDKVNVAAVGYLRDECEKYSSHFIHISTDFIFDGEEGPYSETDEPNPLSYYGLSKLKSEQLLYDSTINWTILRTIILYGTAENLQRNNIVLWGRKALKEHLRKRCRVTPGGDRITITDNGKEVELFEDTWRTAGTSQKVASGFGKGMRNCLQGKAAK